MSTKIFVNLAVKDLPQSMEFYRQLGFSFNLQFTDETAACMVISEDIYAMLLTYPKFQQFTPKEICDSTKSSEVLLSLTQESRAAIDSLVARAATAGGKAQPAARDHGFMYQHGFEDPDGHIWELIYMEPGVVQE